MSLEQNSTTTEFPSWFIPLDTIHIICYAFTIVVALLFLFIIIYDKLYTTVPMMLFTNSCISELFFATSLFAMATFRIRNDIRHVHFYDSFCIFMAYLGYVSVGVQNYSYLLQAIYRYILIVHPTRLFYQSIEFQLFLIGSSWIFCTIYPIVLWSTGQIKYIFDDGICQMPLELSFVTIFNAFYVYFIPMSSIILIYLRMVQYMRDMRKHVTTANRLFHAKRELRMIRRIVSLVFILVTLGLPYAIFIFMSFFDVAPKYHFRIAFTFICASLVLVMIALLEITEPLKNSLMSKLSRQQVNVIETRT
ncbi:unnamed protein product [Rotaria magnacalcarata]|uniref:G-protein coupled receptors family 1 profile domain-containing protein n=1 Tax=Rotaria magnacalcarata TaxID=392030 RepID=A0A815Q2V5_9BILA|nr:unnamed protein product [Rotaria magnacalcarata]CAF1485093.1 unnamed protein product [Rotaria magnacalcarata]CAF1900859.1 unnamed protein product [Rotaria magnacalcarata]CAF2031385.1 unnamed protein product [Rotaria magnacalcarata]CAF2055127.1 unnamed protein product [Rotaria magnacalcarata]